MTSESRGERGGKTEGDGQCGDAAFGTQGGIGDS
jgi:hypothetical protein